MNTRSITHIILTHELALCTVATGVNMKRLLNFLFFLILFALAQAVRVAFWQITPSFKALLKIRLSVGNCLCAIFERSTVWKQRLERVNFRKYSMLLGVLFFLNIMAVENAEATAVFVASVDEVDGPAATTWKYHITSSNPGNGASCATDGSWVTSVDSSDPLAKAKSVTVVSLGPPFSGSASSSRYITICKDGFYAILKMTIELSSCALWVCTTRFIAEEISNGAGIDWVFDTIWNNSILMRVDF